MAEEIHDLHDRLNLIKVQIAELYGLNKKFRCNFEHLSVAMLHAKKNHLLDDEELMRLEELNRAANAAKHEGLGIDDPEETKERKDEKRKDEQEMEEAGDCIGDLERCCCKLLGRTLCKKELSYRFRPRPGNIGDYVAIVRLEALDPPMEFVGDAFKLKKVAKHSAALQALNYLELQSAENIKIAAPKENSDGDSFVARRRKRRWMNVELSGHGLNQDEGLQASSLDPSTMPQAPETIRNLANAKGRLLEFLAKEVRRHLEEEEVEWVTDFSVAECGFVVTLILNVEGWAVGTFTGSAFSRKKDAEQDAAKQALLHLQKIKARRPQSLPATLRLPADITVETLLERFLPENLKDGDYDVTCEGCVVDRDVYLGSIGPEPLSLVLHEAEEW